MGVRWAPKVLLGSVAVLAAAGCDRPAADQLMIRVIDGTGGRLVVPGDLDAFEVRVSSLEGPLDGGTQLVRFRRTWALAHAGARGRAVSLPQSLAIVPVAGPGTVRVDVYGLKNGRVLQHIQRVAAFGVGLVELPPFALTPLCFGVECPPGQTCESDGTCRDASDPCGAGGCPGDGPCGTLQVACGDTCVPYDDMNCETCGHGCPAGERCVSNRCACPAGTARCETACVDLQTDGANCGACGRSCSGANATVECRLAACDVVACDPGWEDCDGRSTNGCESPDCVRDAPCTTSCGSTGTSSCTASCGTDCEPPDEECNGVDDDCDGDVDECDDPDAVCFGGACDYPPPGCDYVDVFDGHLYAACDAPADWFLGSDVCYDWGGYLVRVDSAAEDAFLRTFAPGWRWIGLSDYFNEGVWEWEVGSSSYTGWCPEEPSAECCYGEYPGCFGGAPGDGQDCALLGYGCTGGGVGWDDQHCCWQNGFICEVE